MACCTGLSFVLISWSHCSCQAVPSTSGQSAPTVKPLHVARRAALASLAASMFAMSNIPAAHAEEAPTVYFGEISLPSNPKEWQLQRGRSQGHPTEPNPGKTSAGNGCYWGRQHDQVQTEQKLGRKAENISAVVGYAGGADQGKPIWRHAQMAERLATKHSQHSASCSH